MRHRPDFFGIPLIVQGRGPFPLDMLRYDRCVPSDATDVASIEESRIPVDEYPENCLSTGVVRTVHLVRFACDPQFRASTKRWESFGWEVVGGS